MSDTPPRDPRPRPPSGGPPVDARLRGPRRASLVLGLLGAVALGLWTAAGTTWVSDRLPLSEADTQALARCTTPSARGLRRLLHQDLEIPCLSMEASPQDAEGDGLVSGSTSAARWWEEVARARVGLRVWLRQLVADRTRSPRTRLRAAVLLTHADRSPPTAIGGVLRQAPHHPLAAALLEAAVRAPEVTQPPGEGAPATAAADDVGAPPEARARPAAPRRALRAARRWQDPVLADALVGVRWSRGHTTPAPHEAAGLLTRQALGWTWALPATVQAATRDLADTHDARDGGPSAIPGPDDGLSPWRASAHTPDPLDAAWPDDPRDRRLALARAWRDGRSPSPPSPSGTDTDPASAVLGAADWYRAGWSDLLGTDADADPELVPWLRRWGSWLAAQPEAEGALAALADRVGLGRGPDRASSSDRAAEALAATDPLAALATGRAAPHTGLLAAWLVAASSRSGSAGPSGVPAEAPSRGWPLTVWVREGAVAPGQPPPAEAWVGLSPPAPPAGGDGARPRHTGPLLAVGPDGVWQGGAPPPDSPLEAVSIGTLWRWAQQERAEALREAGLTEAADRIGRALGAGP